MTAAAAATPFADVPVGPGPWAHLLECGLVLPGLAKPGLFTLLALLLIALVVVLQLAA